MTHAPTFRYWGEVDPRDRRKLPVQASEPTVTSGPWTMYLYEPIDSYGGYWGTSASEFASALRGVPADADLLLRLNSPGGEVTEAIAIASLIRSRAGRTTATVDGLAASAASYLAVIVDELTMGADAELMIHDPWGVAGGNEADFLSFAALLGATGDKLAAAYARKAGGDVTGWRDVMRAERWYQAAEAVEAKLADSIVGGADEVDEAVEADLGIAASAMTGVYRGVLGRGPLVGLPRSAAAPVVVPPAPADPPAPENTPDAVPAPAATVVDMERFRADLRTALGRS